MVCGACLHYQYLGDQGGKFAEGQGQRELHIKFKASQDNLAKLVSLASDMAQDVTVLAAEPD